MGRHFDSSNGISMSARIVNALGVEIAATSAAVRMQMAANKFFWLDIFAGGASPEILNELGLEPTDNAWALRFGQTGRMTIGRQILRAATWLAGPSGDLLEVHLLSTQRYVLTIWSGDASILDEIRQQFAERVGGLEQSPYHAAGILLQLLLGTLDHVIRDLDLGLDDLRSRLDGNFDPVDFVAQARRQQRLQSIVANFSRFSSAVRTAIVGVEVVAGMDLRGAEELNDYADQVEDVEEQLRERRRWMSDIMHEYATVVAQRQGEQINRLTLVSLIFLPVTALTGFFGMNFNWMIEAIGSSAAFFILGVTLPILCVALTMAWLMHRGLIRFRPLPIVGARSTIAGGGNRPAADEYKEQSPSSSTTG
jgi:Mg2+ and Co2+ transporter CorA